MDSAVIAEGNEADTDDNEDEDCNMMKTNLRTKVGHII